MSEVVATGPFLLSMVINPLRALKACELVTRKYLYGGLGKPGQAAQLFKACTYARRLLYVVHEIFNKYMNIFLYLKINICYFLCYRY